MKKSALFLIFLLFPVIGHGDVIHVPGQYGTIQEAINAASHGDMVLVASGTYQELINFQGKAIVVRSDMDGNPGTLDLSPETTQINGGQGGTVVMFDHNEGPDSVIQGFTILNGTGSSKVGVVKEGGGVRCWTSASPTIRDNRIVRNKAQTGAGICCDDFSSPTIINNYISENEAFNWGIGAGIYLADQTAPVIHSNLIVGNICGSSGGGIFSSGKSLNLFNCIVADNVASYGAGINFTGCKNVEITHCTITGNHAHLYGGGIYGSHIKNPVIQNSILWDNQAHDGGDEIYGSSIELPMSVLTIRGCDLKGGQDSLDISNLGLYVTLEWDEASLIDDDPLFADPQNYDFHLTRLSPCINRGLDDHAFPEDMDGDARPIMGTADMGADEFAGEHPLQADEFVLHEKTGGTVSFALHGGSENAGRSYWILGSVSGTVPGTLLPGNQKTLPIQWDGFTDAVLHLSGMGSGLFIDFFGTLDQKGDKQAAFDTLGPIPGLSGWTVSFAYLLLGPPWDFASNPINVSIVE